MNTQILKINNIHNELSRGHPKPFCSEPQLPTSENDRSNVTSGGRSSLNQSSN